MDYLEVIEQYISTGLRDQFNVVDLNKKFNSTIKYKTLYDQFFKLNQKIKFTNFKKIPPTLDGQELIEILKSWEHGLIPVLDEGDSNEYSWNIPSDWNNTREKKIFPIVFFTSGTSGEKKPLVITLENIIYHYLGVKNQLNLSESTIYGLNLPTYHLSGLMPLFRAFFCGGSVTSLNLKENQKKSITHISIVNSQLPLLLTNKNNYSNLTSVLLGGGKGNFNLIEDCLRQNLPISITYGLSEMSSTVTIRNLQETPFESNESEDRFHVGAPLDYRKLEIKNKNIICSGKTCFLGYFINEQFQPSNGTFLTSDIASLKNGNLFFHSRSDNIFVSGGKNVSQNLIYNMAIKCPYINDPYIKIMDDTKWGQSYVLFYQTNIKSNDIDEKVLSWCNKNLQKEYTPKKVINISENKFGGIKPSSSDLEAMLSPGKTIFLHGLFGETSDWSFAQDVIPESYAIDLNLNETTKTFEEGVEEIKNKIQLISGNTQINIVGYSMGGRIAFHLTRKYPHLIKSLVMISSNFAGIKKAEDKRKRQLNDSKLLESITDITEYKTFLTSWYKQPLFGKFNLTDSYRIKLSQVNESSIAKNKRLLEVFSTGNQDFLLKKDYEALKDKSIKYIYGEDDTKYKQIAMNAPDFIKTYKITSSSHACHSEQKDQFLKILQKTII